MKNSKIDKIKYNLFSIVYLFKKIFFCEQKLERTAKNHIIYLTPFAIKYDGRVRKSVDALLAKGFRVEIIKPADCYDDAVPPWHGHLKITAVGLSGSYSHFPYVADWKVMQYLGQSDASHIFCRDIFTGVMGTLIGKNSDKNITVDFYEWYAQARDYNFKKRLTKKKSLWKRELFKFYERYICKNAGRLITNNLSFAREISQSVVPLDKFTIIRNMPTVLEIGASKNLKNLIPKKVLGKKILYYVGQLSFDRKLDTIIKGMRNLDDCVLIIQGTGYLDVQKIYADILEGLSERVFFLPPINHQEIISYAASADVGVFICDSQDAKMYNALPNKLFEYVYAGIPQISCEGAEINKIIREEKIGLLFDAYDPESFSNAVLDILEESSYQQIQKNAQSYREKLFKEKDFERIL